MKEKLNEGEQLELDLPLQKVNTEDKLQDNISEEEIEYAEQLSMYNSPAFASVFKPKKSSKKLKIFGYLLLALICVGVIVYTGYEDFSKGEMMTFGDIIKTIGSNWVYLAVAVCCFLGTYLCQGLKISIMLKKYTGKFRFFYGLKTAILGKFYDYITPLGSGGQPFEIFHLVKHGVDGGTATAIPLSSFFYLQLMFGLLIGVSLIFKPQAITSAVMVLACIGLFFILLIPFLIILFSLCPKMTSKIVAFIIGLLAKFKIVKDTEKATEKALSVVRRNAECVKSTVLTPSIILSQIIFSIGYHACVCSVVYFTLKTFGYDLPSNGIVEWVEIACITMILHSAVSFVPTPGNAGASEVTFYFVFVDSLAGGVGFTALMIWRLLSFYAYLIVGGLSQISIKRKKE